MTRRIPHSQPTLSSSESRAVTSVLRSGMIAQGKKVAEFERRLCRFTGARHASAVNSGTSALHAALLAMGVGRNDQVIIPSFTCSALLNAVLYTGAAPVIVDVNEDDFNISIEAVRRRLTRKTKAVIAVHNFGLPADIAGLKKLGIPVIEDCAHAIGATIKGKRVGGLADAAVFSFYATKMMTTAEGGMVVSNNRKWIAAVRDIRAYDNREAFRLRYNYKMTDMQAALGIEQLKRLPSFLKKRRQTAAFYSRRLGGHDFILPGDDGTRRHVFFRYVIRLNKNNLAAFLIREMSRRGIECSRPVYKPLHHYVRSRPCPVTDRLMRTTLSLPIYPSLTAAQRQTVVEAILRCLPSR